MVSALNCDHFVVAVAHCASASLDVYCDEVVDKDFAAKDSAAFLVLGDDGGRGTVAEGVLSDEGGDTHTAGTVDGLSLDEGGLGIIVGVHVDESRVGVLPLEAAVTGKNGLAHGLLLGRGGEEKIDVADEKLFSNVVVVVSGGGGCSCVIIGSFLFESKADCFGACCYKGD